MSSPTEPDWSLLPANPVAFFSLSAEYDLRDLKRSYNALIRVFKPEKHPKEFQILRAAFAQLNDALRYEEPPVSLPDLNLQSEWMSSPQDLDRQQPLDQAEEATRNEPQPAEEFAEPESPVSAPESKLHPASLQERLLNESPEVLYHEFKNKAVKSPYEFYLLAILSDLVEQPGTTFPDWLLKGLQAYPHDPVLFELLREFFISAQYSENLSNLLEATAQVVRSDRFYYLTERSWDLLLRHSPFDEFRQTLDNCENCLLDHRTGHKIVFYMHILRPAIWKADQSWLREAFNQININHQKSHWVDEELDFLDLLFQYRMIRNQFLSGGSLRSFIDQAIIEYFRKGDLEGTRRFLEFQLDLVSCQEEILHEFNTLTDDLIIVQVIWERITGEILDGLEDRLVQEDENLFQQQTQQLACQLVEEGVTPETERADQVFKFFLATVLLIDVFTVQHCLAYWDERFWLSVTEIIGLILMNPAAVYYGYRLWEQTTYNFSEYWWRIEIMHFYQTARFPLTDVALQLKRLNGKTIEDTKLVGLDEISRLLLLDLGLWFYSTSQRLLTACE